MSADDIDEQENKENLDQEASGELEKEGEIDLEDFASEVSDDEQREDKSSNNIEALYEIPVRITAVIGTATMPVSQLVKMGRGAVVELDKKLGDAVDIYANNRLIARGEVVVVDDNHIGVTMTEIISATPSVKG